MTILNDFLYLAGNFTSYSNTSCPGVTGLNLAEYSLNNTAFTNLFQLNNLTLKGSINLVSAQNGELFVSGTYSSILSSFHDRLSFYDRNTNTWSPVINPQYAIPFTGEVYAVTGWNGNLYFGGYFTSNYWGVVRLTLDTSIWSSMDSGLACTFCPVVGDGTEALGNRRIPWINTVALLPPGQPPVFTPTNNAPQMQLIGSQGMWAEYGIAPFPGSSVLFQNDTQFTLSTLGDNSLPKYFYWQTWSVVGAAIFIGSLVLASMLHVCVRSVTRY